MTPERWHQVKAIFNSAIQYSPDARASYLADACKDDEELLHEVTSLIASHEKSGDFIDDPAYENASSSFAERAELASGQSVGSYEVVSFISRGGMGEVYLALDQRLKRKVAVKLLPLSFARDRDRLRRFEQEARAASALNHPNIITIYEISRDGATPLIATEFVEGETLRHRLAKSSLSLNESLNIGIQIADALAAAHKAGIIHRDIKPENVMLRPDGYIKVLDFGLAKLTEETHDAQEAPTMQVRTGSGMVMGTAGYMSPEQARGLSVDGRSDIFSLGAVMYEMFAGQKPFHGETPSDTLAAILKTEPAPLRSLVTGLPDELVRIVNKSLRKDREERYQVIKDLLLDLKALKQELEFQEKLEVSPSTSTGEATSGARNDSSKTAAVLHHTDPSTSTSSIIEALSAELKRPKAGTIIVLCAVAVFMAAGAVKLYRYLNRTTHFSNVKLSRLTNSGDVIDVATTPDGKYIVYVLSDRSSQSVWIRQVSTANDKLIVEPGPVGYFGITISPDGSELYYALKTNLDAGTLYRIPVLGGTPVKILSGIDGPVSFSPDGQRFTFIRNNHPTAGDSALLTANLDGSDQRTLVVKKVPERFAPIFFTGPSWSPDGKLVATSVYTVGKGSRLMAYSTADGTEQSLTRQEFSFTARVSWLKDMSGLLAVAGTSPSTAQHWLISYPSGEARSVTNDLNAYRSISLTSRGDMFSTIQASGLVNLWVVPNGDASKAVRLPTGNFGFYTSFGNNISWTPDGRIAYVSNEGGGADIWITDADGRNRKQLSANGNLNVSPVVSPDGKLIVYAGQYPTGRNIWRMNIDGSNPVRLTSGLADSYPSISPDGKWVIYSVLERAKPAIWRISIDGGQPEQLVDHTALSASISPDGKLLAYTYPESTDSFAPPNRIAIFNLETKSLVQTFEMPTTSLIASVTQWSADGKSIYYSANTNNVTNIWSQPITGGPAVQVTQFKDSLISGFAWTRDGKTLACSRGQLIRDAVLISESK